MHYIISKLKSPFLLLGLLTLTLVNCDNDPASLGIDVLPPSDVIFAAIDSQQVKIANITPKEILSDGYSKSAVGLLGIFNDPVFGVTKADFIAELNIATAIDSFDLDGLNFFRDSAVLSLYYKENYWYGNKYSKLNVKVYELNERLDTDSAYYSNFDIDGKYFPTLIGEKIVTPYDSTRTEQGADTIRIKLSNDFADKLFEAKNISIDNKNERDKFKDFINGIYVTVGDEINDNGALLKIDILNTLSNVTLYYKKEIYDLSSDQVLGIRTNKYTFPISTAGRMFNRFEHTLSDNVKLDEENSDRIFVQGLAGTFAKIDLSDVYAQWKDSVKTAKENNINLEISGVDLTFYVDTNKTTIEKELYLPDQTTLGIYTMNENGTLSIPYFKNGEGYSDSFYSSGIATYSSTTNSYIFSMTKDYFSKIIHEEEEEQYFYLKLPSSAFNFKRISLYNNNDILHPKIKVRYVTF